MSLARPSWAAAIVLGLSCRAPADVLVLYNGERLMGQIVEETPDHVRLSRRFRDTSITFEDLIERKHIVRIERGDVPAASQPASQPAPQVRRASSRPAYEPPDRPWQSRLTVAERSELLDKAVTQWQEHRYVAAAHLLSRLINNTSQEDLRDLSAEAERRLEMSLADFAAETRLRAGIQKGGGASLRLGYVTAYEKPALVPRLEQAYVEALGRRVPVSRKEPADPLRHRPGGGQGRRPHESADSQPADRRDHGGSAPAGPGGETIEQWLDRPAEFDADRATSRAMADHVRYTLSILSERMRIDPALKDDGELRSSLTRERTKLRRLLDAVEARSRGALTPQERQVRIEEQERLADLRRDTIQRWQKAADEEVKRARKAVGLDVEERPAQPQPPPASAPADRNPPAPSGVQAGP